MTTRKRTIIIILALAFAASLIILGTVVFAVKAHERGSWQAALSDIIAEHANWAYQHIYHDCFKTTSRPFWCPPVHAPPRR